MSSANKPAGRRHRDSTPVGGLYMSDLPVLPQDTALTGAAAGAWGAAILDALDAPVTEANVYSFAGWFHNEGGGGQNNPMNSTEGSEYPAINSAGVRNYPTPDIGVAETVATLQNGYYPAIVASFRAGVGLGDPNEQTASELSTWSGGGYSSITPIVVPMPAAPPAPKPTPKPTVTEEIVIAAFADEKGIVHIVQETTDGDVYHVRQESANGAWEKTSTLVLSKGKRAS